MTSLHPGSAIPEVEREQNARAIIEISRDHNPFPQHGVTTCDGGAREYRDLPATLVELLRTRAETSPDAAAIVEVGGPELDYADLWASAMRVAGGLLEAGVEPGDRVAIRYPSGVTWVLAFWGCLLAGAIPVAVNTRSTQSEIDFILNDAGVKLDLRPGVLLPLGESFANGEAQPQDTAALFYTSGTTSRPKGVPVSHRAFLTNAENAARCFTIPSNAREDYSTLISAPLFHVTACNSQLILAHYVGGSAIILPNLDISALLEAIPRYRISFLVTVPAVYALMLRHPDFANANVGSVRWLGYGGAPISSDLVLKIKAAFPGSQTFNGYGMTETASLISVLPDADAGLHPGSIGFAVPTIDLAIAPFTDDTSTGELLVRGANVFGSYWNRPEATAEAFADGWFRTGDVVKVDREGRMMVIDRVKDVINRGGENISSIEIESVLASAPGVREIAALGIPDDVMGEKVGVVIYGDDNLNVDDVVDYASRELADFKVPQFIAVFNQPLPRNAGGKLLKAELRNQVSWGNPLR